MNISTPRKKYTHLPFEAHNICIHCCKKITDSNLILKLRNSDGEKTSACIEFEKYIHEEIGQVQFKIICKGCIRKVRNGIKGDENRKKQWEISTSLLKTYVVSKEKRASKISNSDVIPKIKKTLSIDESNKHQKDKVRK